jgi:tetratricopeptide (TPR) repeat protein/transcriptional regulator with XRE-family HTH domain
MSFAALLRQLRTHAGLTQEELAEAARLSVRSVSDLERGINLTARRDTTRLLADALNLNGPARTMFEAAARGLMANPSAVVDESPTAAAEDATGTPEGGPTAAVHALPHDTASFTGRTPELDQLMSELETALSGDGSGSVVGVHAIDGMAGIGKTTFAVHAAHLLAPRFPDGQFFLPLHSHTPGQQPADPGAALGTLLLATGIATSQIPDGLDARTMLWRNGVAGKRILLVLDDAGSHEQVRPLLPGSPDSLVLITSRRRLAALEEATPISLDTLPPADAAELFTRLTARAGREAEAVAEITRLCGYLPLAIRLVAGTLRRHPSWTVTDLATELATTKDRLAAMRAENLSVAAAFDLSYADLTGDQQRLFRRLGLHPGTSIDASAAAALDGTSLRDARRRLDDLYDHHLITEPARGRYHLHDLLREHASSLAEEDDDAGRDAAIDRLLDYYLYTATAANRLIARRPPAYTPPIAHPPAAAPELTTRDEAMAWLETERANLQAGADFAADRARPVHAVWLPAQLSEFLRTRGYWDQALRLHQKALTVAVAAEDRAGQATALASLGNVHYERSNYPEAIRCHTEAIGLYRALDDDLELADALISLGLVQAVVDDRPAATAALTEALRLSRDLGDRLGQADALDYLGFLQYVTSDYPAASASLQEALTLYRDLDDRRGQAEVLCDFGRLQRYTGDYQLAIAALTQSLSLFRELDRRRSQALVLTFLGAVQGLTDDYDSAAASLEQAVTLFQDLGSRHGLAEALVELGVVQHRTGDADTAAATLAEAMALFRDVGDRQGQADALNHLAALQAATIGPAEGIARYSEALGITRDIGSPLEEAAALEGIGCCQIQAGEVEDGLASLRQALQIYERIGAPGAERVRQVLGEHSG